MNNRYRTSEVAEIMGISERQLYHWDKVGLVRPSWRDEDTGWRQYSDEDLRKIGIILEIRSCDECKWMPLDSLKQLFDGIGPEGTKKAFIAFAIRDKEIVRNNWIASDCGQTILKAAASWDCFVRILATEERQERAAAIAA